MTTAIAEFNKFDAQMREFKKRYENVVYDLTDPEQEKRAKADKLAIGKIITKLDSSHKELKAPLKEKTDLLDGERKRIKDDLLNFQGNIKDQLETHKQEILDHAIMLNDKVLAIVDLGLLIEFLDSNGVRERIISLDGIEVDDSYETRKADAALAQIDTRKILADLLERKLKHEAEQAELERLRAETAAREQKDREEEIRKGAETKAKADSEHERAKAIRDKEAAEQATKDAIEAGKRQKETADRRAKEQADFAAQAERNRIEHDRLMEIEAAKKRKADTVHHAKINNEALAGIVHLGVSQKIAIKVVTAIAKGKIPHITIAY